jgi:hypothetical protein
MPDLLCRLDAEWRRFTGSPRARRALMRWKTAHPSLGQLENFDELLATREREPEAAREMLAALASMAPCDELAAQVLLQALVPGLIRLSLTVGHNDHRPLDEMISLAWERIRTYPATRQGSVAANVLRDVAKSYRRHREIDRPRKRHQIELKPDMANGGSDDAVAERVETVPSAEEVALGRAIVNDVLAAQRNGIISEHALRLIVETRLLGVQITEIAAREGRTWNTVASWRFRAERRVRETLLAG